VTVLAVAVVAVAVGVVGMVRVMRVSRALSLVFAAAGAWSRTAAFTQLLHFLLESAVAALSLSLSTSANIPHLKTNKIPGLERVVCP
jgi:hypothetical protein